MDQTPTMTINWEYERTEDPAARQRDYRDRTRGLSHARDKDHGLDITWMESAACVGAPVEVFFPDSEKRGVWLARAEYCTRCMVKAECREFAVVTESPGIWGGMTTRERAQQNRLTNTERG